MRLVLTQDIENLGKRGEIVEVARGYGRNYLLPRKMAREATPGNIKQVEIEKARWAKREAKEKEAAEAQAQQLTKLSLTIARKVGENDTLYGSVTNGDVAEAIEAQGFEIDKRKVEMAEPIKTIGEFDVPIHLFRDVVAQVKVNVVAEE